MDVRQPPDDFCPYVGLQPYNEADRDYFFGRERDSRIISSNLYAAALTVLYGASGVGKSSVLRAGVLPHLKSSARTAVLIFDGWADQNLLNTLKNRCLEAITEANGGKDLQIDVDQPFDELLFLATRESGCTLLIILDQFEEYFLYHPEADNQFDIEFARAINREEVDCNFMVAMREDSLSRLDRFRARIPHMLSNSLRLRYLDAPSARDAVRKPLDVYAIQHPSEPPMSIEAELVEELIEEIQVEKLMIGQGGRGVVERPDGVDGEVRIEAPFLQLALTRLWHEERNQGSQVMRMETLRNLGGAGRIIRTHMDSAMEALTPEEQDTVAGIFRYMVTPSGTKIAYTIADLEYYARSTRPLEPILQKLAQGEVRIMRAVTSPGEPGVIRYQIYHDVLAPAVLDWRTRNENSKQLLNLYTLLVEKGDLDGAFERYQEIIQRTPQRAFFPAHYEVRRILGKSELGISYAIYDRDQDRMLGVTILDPSFMFTPEDLEQFASEMRKLSSPRISTILGFETYRESTYMLSVFIDGPNLRARIAQGPLTYMEAMNIARQITEAIEDGHHQGVPHLNLRPNNVMLSSDGVKLVNYGISRLTALDRNPDRPARRYMDDYLAPEQLARKGGDERSDIYATGTILYEMLIGHPPSQGRFYYPSEVILEATEAVDILIDHARENEPNRRFASAKEMRSEIDRITMRSITGNVTQFLRVGLAWTSEQYKKLITGKRLPYFLIVLAGFYILSNIQQLRYPVLLPARVITAMLLNSFVLSILCDWVIRALARRRGLGSLSASGRGVGVILGLVLTIHVIASTGFRPIYWTSGALLQAFYIAGLALVIFLAALALGFIIAVSWISERLFKSYTTGFYWGFVVVLIIELILIILKKPEHFLSFI